MLNAENTVQKKIRILIAEDNEINQKVIHFILASTGHNYEFAKDGQEALSKYEGGKFDLILMDCQMPVMDGLQVSQKIRESEKLKSKKRCAIVAMTANAMQGDKDRCLAAGMDDFLAKPFKKQDLLKVVEDWYSKAVA